MGYIIEFSIGLAGFSGVVAIFSSRSSGDIELHRWRIRNLLLLSMGPAFISFFALGFLEIASSQHQALRWSCLLQALFLAVALYVVLSTKARLSKELQSKLQLPVLYFFLALLASLAFLLALVGFGIEATDAYLTFYFALVLTLFIGAYQFVRAVLQGLGGR